MIRLAVESDAQRIGEMWAEMVSYHARFDAATFQSGREWCGVVRA